MINSKKLLFYYPSANELRGLEVFEEEDGTFSYEWKSRLEKEGFASYEAALADAKVEGEKLYPGLVPATGKEGAYGSVDVEDPGY